MSSGGTIEEKQNPPPSLVRSHWKRGIGPRINIGLGVLSLCLPLSAYGVPTLPQLHLLIVFCIAPLLTPLMIGSGAASSSSIFVPIGPAPGC